MAFSLQHPFTALVCGPTGCGKTQFTSKVITSNIISPAPEEILWCYGVYQDIFHSLVNVHFNEGLPDLKNFDGSKRTLLIIDDLMHEADDKVTQIFTKGSHHRNISIMFLTQNLFHRSKHARTMSLNAHYIILFKSPRDVGQIGCLGRQMYPTRRGALFLGEAFRDATKRSYGYLFLDLKASTDEELRVRTNILPDESPQYVYLPK